MKERGGDEGERERERTLRVRLRHGKKNCMGTAGYVRGLRVVSMMMSFICSCKNKKGKPSSMYFQEGKDHKRLIRGPSTNDMKNRMVLAAPGPLLSPPPS